MESESVDGQMEINLITPATRMDNLPKIRETILEALKNFPMWQAHWFVVFDATEPNLSIVLPNEKQLDIIRLATASNQNGHQVSAMGNNQRNLGLEHAKTGWVYFLDDDTEIHPNYFDHVHKQCVDHPNGNIVTDQSWNNGVIRLTASANNMTVGNVDSGQVLLRREIIGDTRWEPMHYHSDGIFINAVYSKDPSSFIFVNVAVSVYNFFR